MSEPQRAFFVHLQKTAGTTLFRRMRRHLGDAAVYPDASDGRPPETVLLVDHLLERWRARRSEIRVVTGHFPLCTTEVLGVPFSTFTVLREPVERTLSFLRHHRARTPADRDVPLEVIYEDDIRFHGLVHNHMVKMFALRAEEMVAGCMTRVDFTRAHLDRAKERLESVDVVGLQEDFEPFCAELAARFGWDLGPPEHTNRTEPVDVSPAFVERIAHDNALDVELYEFARDLVRRRRDPGAPARDRGAGAASGSAAGQ